MITPMFEHVTWAHAGTRHVSHGEHAPLAYFASRSLPWFLTPSLCFFSIFFSLSFLSLSHTSFYFLPSLPSFFYQIQMYSALIFFASIYHHLLFLFIPVSFFYLLYILILSSFGWSIIRSGFQDRILFFNFICSAVYTYSDFFIIFLLYYIKLFELWQELYII